MEIIKLSYAQVVRDYLDHLSTHNRRPDTVKGYNAQLRAIYPAVVQTIGYLEWSEITETDIHALLDALTVSEHSRRMYLDGFGRLVQFQTGRNPVKEADILWDEVSIKRKWISDDGWQKLKASAKNPLDMLILYFGAYMGLRRVEMVRIKLSDIDGPYLTVHGKGHGKDGKVVRMEMPEPVQSVLRQYMMARSTISTTSEQLLIRIDGKQRGKELTPDSIRYACDNMGKRAGVDFSTHSLRRLCVTKAYEASGHDLDVTRRISRHESVDVLMNCYLKADESKVRNTVGNMIGML